MGVRGTESEGEDGRERGGRLERGSKSEEGK